VCVHIYIYVIVIHICIHIYICTSDECCNYFWMYLCLWCKYGETQDEARQQYVAAEHIHRCIDCVYILMYLCLRYGHGTMQEQAKQQHVAAEHTN